MLKILIGSDSESNYDNNAEYLDVWPEYRESCDKLGCDYRPSDMEGYDENKQLGLRPNGTHELYYLCELCGRKFCDSYVGQASAFASYELCSAVCKERP